MTKVTDAIFFTMAALHRQRRSIEAISRSVGVSRSTVRYALRRGPPSKRAMGRRISNAQKRTTMTKRRRLVARLARRKLFVIANGGKRGRANRMIVTRNEFSSTPAIARELFQRGFTVHHATVRRDLLFMGFRSRVKPKGPRRVVGDVEQRLIFSKKYVGVDAARFLFSDEHIADTNDHVGHRQWCPPGTAPDHREYYHWSPKLHVWGLIGIGVKILVIFPKGLAITSRQYIRRCLMNNVTTLSRPGMLFVQDGAKAHTSAESIGYLGRKGVNVVPHGRLIST